MPWARARRYDAAASAHRREASAKLLTSLVQRDADARRHLIVNGCLKQILGLLNPKVCLCVRTCAGQDVPMHPCMWM